MASLDNESEIKNLDRDNILANIREFPEQCERCWADWQKMALPAGFIQAKNVVLCGMGGSGIGGSLAKSLAETSKIPVVVWKDYNLPGFVDRDTLVVCTSYSGNTEEVISSLKKAAEKTNKIVTISTGGKIASLATNFRNPHYKIEYGSDPRAALGYIFISILSIFIKLGFIELKDDEFKEAILLLKGLQKKIDTSVPEGANAAKMLARKISARMPATTTDRDTRRSDGKLKAIKMAAVKIPKGVLVCINTSGYAVNGADNANFLFAGVSYEQIDNSAGQAGDRDIRVEKTGEHEFVYNGGDAGQALVGKEAYIIDNQTVDADPLVTTNDIKCGTIAEIIGVNSVRVRIDRHTV